MSRSPTLSALSTEDRRALEQRLLQRQSGKCFICDDVVDLVLHQGQLEEYVGDPASEKTALWEYYQPILQALVALGGEATSAQLEERVGPLLEGRLKQGDKVTMSDGRPRWKILVKRARRHMVREGFLEDIAGARWRISPTGRKAAESGKTHSHSST